MNQQASRTLQQIDTSLAPAEVLAAATEFFSRRLGIYAAFLERESPTHLNFRGQGGEELLIGVVPRPGGTAVTGSTYLFDQQVARFFASLPSLPEAPSPPALPGSADRATVAAPTSAGTTP